MTQNVEHEKNFQVRVGRSELGPYNDRVYLRFPKSIQEIYMLPEQAIEIAKDIIKYANEIIEEKEGRQRWIKTTSCAVDA